MCVCVSGSSHLVVGESGHDRLELLGRLGLQLRLLDHTTIQRKKKKALESEAILTRDAPNVARGP